MAETSRAGVSGSKDISKDPSFSPWTFQENRGQPLRQDSEGNISGVEYLAHLSGLESGSEGDVEERRKFTIAETRLPRKPRRKKKCIELRRASTANADTDVVDTCNTQRPKSTSDANDSECSQLGPDFGRRPAGYFLLASDSEIQDSASDISNLDLSAGFGNSAKATTSRINVDQKSEQAEQQHNSRVALGRGRRFRRAQIWQQPAKSPHDDTASAPVAATLISYAEDGLTFFPVIEPQDDRGRESVMH